MKAQRVDVIHVDGQTFELAPGVSRWHIETGVDGKFHGLSYCEACEYIPPKVAEYKIGYLDPIDYRQTFTRYCPNCGRRMSNSDDED